MTETHQTYKNIRIIPTIPTDPPQRLNPPPIQPSITSHVPQLAPDEDGDEDVAIVGAKRKKKERKKKKKTRRMRRWSDKLTDSGSYARFFAISKDVPFGRSFREFIKSNEMMSMYHKREDTSSESTDESENESEEQEEPSKKKRKTNTQYRLGPSLPSQFVTDGESAIEHIKVITRNDLLEDADKYGIDVSSTTKNALSTYLRREILVYLAKMKSPVIEFAGLLATAFGMGFTTDDFVWIFPQDVLNLSTKDPLLTKGKSYGAQDFITELIHMFAAQQMDTTKDKDIQTVFAAIKKFILNISRFNTPKPPVRPTNQRNSPVSPSKFPPEKKGAKIKGEEEEEPKGPSPTGGMIPHTGSRNKTPSLSPNTLLGLIASPEQSEILEDWKIELDKLIHPDYRKVLFKPNVEDPDSVPLGLILLKPHVRGMIRDARSRIIIEAKKDFTVEELLYSKDINTYFASFIAIIQGYNSTIFNTGALIPKSLNEALSGGSFSGNINIYNSRPSRYNTGQLLEEKLAAIEFFKRVFRRTSYDGTTYLEVMDKPNNGQPFNPTTSLKLKSDFLSEPAGETLETWNPKGRYRQSVSQSL